MKKTFLPFVSIVSMILGQLSTFIVYFLFDKNVAGQVATIIVWATFFSQIIFMGGDQSLLRRHLQQEERTLPYRSAQSLYFTLSLLIPLITTIFLIVNYGVNSLYSIGALSIFLFSLQKWYELECKVNAKYDMYLYTVLLISIGLLLLYLSSWVSRFFDVYDALVIHRFLAFFGLLFLLRKMLCSCVTSFSLSGWLTEFNKDLPFLFLLLMSFTNIFFDKLYLSVVVEPGVYADYGLLVAAYGLMIQPKVILSNQYLPNLNLQTQYYFNKVKSLSLIVTIFVGLIGMLFYWIATSFILHGYHFFTFSYLILFLSAVIEASLGPAGMILSYKYKPKYNLVAELVGFCILVLVVVIASIYNSSPSSLICYVALALALAKTTIAFIKLTVLKKIESEYA
jgi:hypothetical protein